MRGGGGRTVRVMEKEDGPREREGERKEGGRERKREGGEWGRNLHVYILCLCPWSDLRFILIDIHAPCVLNWMFVFYWVRFILDLFKYISVEQYIYVCTGQVITHYANTAEWNIKESTCAPCNDGSWPVTGSNYVLLAWLHSRFPGRFPNTICNDLALYHLNKGIKLAHACTKTKLNIFVWLN